MRKEEDYFYWFSEFWAMLYSPPSAWKRSLRALLGVLIAAFAALNAMLSAFMVLTHAGMFSWLLVTVTALLCWWSWALLRGAQKSQ